MRHFTHVMIHDHKSWWQRGLGVPTKKIFEYCLNDVWSPGFMQVPMHISLLRGRSGVSSDCPVVFAAVRMSICMHVYSRCLSMFLPMPVLCFTSSSKMHSI